MDRSTTAPSRPITVFRMSSPSAASGRGSPPLTFPPPIPLVKAVALHTMACMAVEPEAMRRAHEWLKEVYARQPEREGLFTTISGEPVKPLYTDEDLADNDRERDIGYPGEYPFTRGVYPSMYRGRLWTMRQFAGFGTA